MGSRQQQTIPSTQTQTVKVIQLKLKRSFKSINQKEQDGRGKWIQLVLLEAIPCVRCRTQRPKEQPELNASPLPREFPSPLQRASGTVLVELVELPMGPVAISNPDTNNNDNNNNNHNCSDLSTRPTSVLASYNSSNSTGPNDRISTISGSSSTTSISSISSSSLPPYSELVKELGTL